MEIIAKPKGTSLKVHTQNVMDEGTEIVIHHPFVLKKYKEITSYDLAKRLNGAALYHDEGKKHPSWQTACQKAFQTFLKTGKTGDDLKLSGIRHEIESLKMYFGKGFSNPVQVAIAAHHAKFSFKEKFQKNWVKDELSKKIWSLFIALSDEVSMERNLKKSILYNYEYSGVRGYLQLADHRASIKEDDLTVPIFNTFKYTFEETWVKKNVQILVEKYWQDYLLLLRAPTGSGKTDACLLWAKKQIENGRADRLIIAMPTRFTSNALSINITDSVTNRGLYHSSAWFTEFIEQSRSDYKTQHFAKLQHEFARLLENPVTVCTIDHLLIAQTHTREDHHLITFNLSNSCVVIDEADFYDEFTQANIVQLLKILNILQVPVLIMSASLPESCLALYQSTGYKVTDIKEDISDYKRKRFEIIEKKEYAELNDIEDLLELAITEPTIIYANTVARAMEFYSWFKKRKIDNVTLYHSRFTEPHKLNKEQILLKNLGKQAWVKGEAKGIAILTQIGEMSINISAKLMLSEIAPIDRLVQRAGRLCRFSEEIGRLFLLIPQKKNELYPAPYGTFKNKEGWTANIYLKRTLDLIELKKYNAREMVELINKVYPLKTEWSDKTKINLEYFEKHILNNWLIVPAEQPDIDEESTSKWKSRDINAQKEIFTIEPDKYFLENPQKSNKVGDVFDNYKELNFYKNKFSVQYPSYLVSKGILNGLIYSRNILIGYEKEPKMIWCTNDRGYCEEIGMNIDIENDNFL